jgi:S-(hydroxymethyl)glutathione dehydrogenase/alcohol dehydrogenase
MRAVVFRDPDRPVEVADVELDAPKPGEVRVRIAAAGVCHSDLHVRRGDWHVATPLVMGHEGSGTVVATGAGVTSVREGDPVILSWVPACGRCRNCKAGHPARCELCADLLAPHGVLYDGTTRLHREGERIHHYLSVSSFAEEVVVPESGAIPIDPDAPLEVMALIGCAVATGVGAVRRTAAVPEGASVAVIGCGGVGLSVLMGAALAGAHPIIAVDVEAQLVPLVAVSFGLEKIAVTGPDQRTADAVVEFPEDDVVFGVVVAQREPVAVGLHVDGEAARAMR